MKGPQTIVNNLINEYIFPLKFSSLLKTICVKLQQIMIFWKNVLYLAFISGVVGEIFEVLIICILIAKYYIHNKKLLDDNNIEFLHFLYVLKFKLDIEHQICEMNNTTQTFNKFVFLYDQMWYQHIPFMK